MTKSLVVYDEIIREKRREKEDILSEITELKREVKRLNTEVKKYKYRSESLHQEERKIKHTSSRKSKERFFITKEIADINSDIPTLFHHIQAMNDLKEKL
jgi:cell division septum initiation protein DivIVA